MTRSEERDVIITIVCISFLQGLQFSLSPVLGKIARHFHDVEVSRIQMLITIPSLIAVLVALTSGWLVLRISKKKLLLFAAMIAAVSGFAPFLEDSFSILFASRMIFGISCGLATTLNTAVVSDFFEGDKRVTVMGIQAASIGVGMVCITTLSGWLGAERFQASYWVNVIGIVALVLITVCLPERGKETRKKKEKIQLKKEVYIASCFAFLESFFLISFSTNIAMHLSGPLAENSMVTGCLSGIFSGIQILAGLILGKVTKITKNFTMPVAMLSFSVGAIILALFPSNLTLLMTGALFCGFSQGIFIPTGMVTVSNAVTPVATTMASAFFTSGMSLGQFFSPMMLNNAVKMLFGEVTTGRVYLVAAVGMAASALLAAIWKSKND